MDQRITFTKALIIAGALWIPGSFAATSVMAASMTFNFSGAVSDVSAALFPSLNAGHALTGSYTFNTATVDSNPSANIGRYNGTIQALTVNLVPAIGPTYTATLGNSGSNFIEVRNQPSSDRYLLQAPLTGPSVNGYSPLRFRIELIDPSATAFANDSLPSSPPSLSSFAASRFRIVFEDGSGNARVRGTLTSLTAVPLPTAVILFGAGLLALVGLGAGSRRQKQTSPA